MEKTIEQNRKKFQEAVEHVIKYLNEYHSPHTTVIITPVSAELLTGEISHHTEEYLKDLSLNYEE